MDYRELNQDCTLKKLLFKMNPLGLNMGTNEVFYCFLPDLAVPMPDPNKRRRKEIRVEEPILIPSGAETYFANLNARKDRPHAAYGDGGATQQLLNAIAHNKRITYIGRSDYHIGCRKQMINKISYYVSQSDERNIRSILSNPPIQVFPKSQAFLRPVFVDAIQRLYESGTYGGYVYGIFLLIMNTIFYLDMATLLPLYQKEKINEVIRISGASQVSLPDNHYVMNNRTYFNHEYHVYLFADDKSNFCQHGSLNMEMKDGIASVKLGLNDLADSNQKYVGKACVSECDDTVYSLMCDVANQNAIGFLCFRYNAVNIGRGMRSLSGMSYRSGLLVTTDSKKTPECRKIVITERKMNDHELCYVEGVLKTSGSQIMLSESQIGDFLEKHKNAKLYPWLNEFEHKIQPFLKANYGQTPLFSFDEKAVLSYPNATLTKEDRLRIMLALKACCANVDEKYSRIHCDDEGVSDILC